jgi:hypothetical protein
MKYLTIVLLICSNQLWSQSQDVKTDTVKKKIIVDFTLLIVPTKISNLEHYYLGFDRQITSKRYFGVGISAGIGESKAFPEFRTVSYSLSCGYRWSLVKNKNWFVAPHIRALYLSQFDMLDEMSYRSGGIRGGFNVRRNIGRFGIGVAASTTFTVGYLKTPMSAMPFDGVTWRWFWLNYGLNLSYTF